MPSGETVNGGHSSEVTLNGNADDAANVATVDRQQLLFCERFVEFMIDLMSQAPTRRYSHALLEDKAVLIKCRMSSLFQHGQGTQHCLLPFQERENPPNTLCLECGLVGPAMAVLGGICSVPCQTKLMLKYTLALRILRPGGTARVSIIGPSRREGQWHCAREVLLYDSFSSGAPPPPVCKVCAGQLFRQLVDLFQFYMLFPISNYDSEPISDEDMMAAHYARVQQLQLLLFYKHPALKDLALHNCGTVASRKALLEHVSALQEEELRKLVVRELR